MYISVPSKTTKIFVDGAKREMTPEEYREYLKISGPAIRAALDKRLEYIKKMPTPEAQKKYIDDLVQQERDRAKFLIQKQAN